MKDHDAKTRSLPRAILLTLPILLLMAMMVTGGQPVPKEPIKLIPLIVAYLFTVGIFFLIVYTGRTHRYRSVLFVTYAVAFVMTFIPNLLEMRGSMAISRAEMIQGHTPFCHMVIPMTADPGGPVANDHLPGLDAGGLRRDRLHARAVAGGFDHPGPRLVQLGLLLRRAR